MTKLKIALDVETDTELSKLLGVKRNTISSWKKRNTMDHQAIIAICEQKKISLDYIFYGKKPVYFKAYNEDKIQLKKELEHYKRIESLQAENSRLKDKIIELLEKKGMKNE